MANEKPTDQPGSKDIQVQLAELSDAVKNLTVTVEQLQLVKAGCVECSCGPCAECSVCSVCRVCEVCKVCRVCQVCQVCQVCKVCKICDVCYECSCGPCSG